MIRMTLLVAVVTTLTVGSVASGLAEGLQPCESDEGTPFGDTTDAHAAALVAFAKGHGLEDLEAAVRSAYAGDQKSLAAVFRLANQFRTVDDATRAYGNILHSMLLNIGEARGLERFTSVLLRQDAATLQRVRDFLYYPAVCLASPEDRAVAERLVREQFPRFWPTEYVFSDGNALFKWARRPTRQ